MVRRKLRIMKWRKVIILFVTLIILYTIKSNMAEKTSHPSSLQIKGKEFVLEGKPFQILCGAIHYFRITPDSWDDRIKKAKGMGLNSVDM